MEFPNPKATHQEWNQWWQEHQEMLKQIPEIMDHYQADIREALEALNQEAHQRGDEQTFAYTADVWELVNAMSRVVETLGLTNAAHEAGMEELTKQRDQILSEYSELVLAMRDFDMSHPLLQAYNKALYEKWRSTLN